jgi:diguanylate cyclase
MSTVLVVDDNATNRKLVTALLAFEGYDTFEARDGAEGLDTARRIRPDLVISDILMPSMDGYEFVRRLRADAELATTLVIFYTAHYHTREAQTLALQCQVSRVVTKPCASAELLSIISDVLTRKTAPAGPPDRAAFDAKHLRLLTDELSQTADKLSVANSSLAALVDLNVQLASERDRESLLRKVCGGARELLGASYAVLAVKGKEHGQGALTISSGTGAAMTSDPVRIDAGLLGKVFADRRSWRVATRDGTPVDAGLPRDFPPARALLAAPIVSLTRCYGWLCLAEKVGAAEFSAEDERMLAALCAQTGRIHENGTLYREVQTQAAQLLVAMEERERTVVALRKSEEQFRELAENIEDVFFLAQPDLAKAIYVSPGYERIWGRPAHTLIENPSAWLDAIHPEDRTRTLKAHRRLAASPGSRVELQFRIVRPDGSIRWILTRIFPILGSDGAVLRNVGVSTDVTERTLAQERIVNLNRVYAMLSGINTLIVRAHNTAELLREACRLAVEQGKFQVAWCAMMDAAGEQLAPVAWAGSFPESCTQRRVRIVSDAAPKGLVANAMASREAAICNDLHAERPELPAGIEPKAFGDGAAVVLPLVVADRAVGCVVLGSSKTNAFDDGEMRLLTEFSGDISFALDHIEKSDRLNYLAYYDSLTGLANRTLFLERLTQHVNTATRAGAKFALVIADPEGIEALNDTLGRTAGDQVIRELASRFARCADSADLVGRMGSDQLAAVIPSLRSTTDVARTIEMWWQNWLKADLEVSGQDISLAARAGIALFPADGGDAEALVRSAEAALKAAKDGGKTYAFFTADLSERLAERLAFEKNMRRALEREEFVLHYQPKVDLVTRHVTGVEALIRWQSPELGLVPPLKFISLMEENGMIVEVGAWALRQASLDRSRWLEKRLAAPRVAVNVSTVQLRAEDFLRTVGNVLRLSGAEAGIDIEVTESLLMEDVSENLSKLAAIRALGVGIALDDFGTGYSSLAYLAKIPVHTLKIDRSFVAAMFDDSTAMTLISTIISLARSLNLETVAEGVESEEQAKILRLIRCDQMQGYLISKPLPFEEMTAFLSRYRATGS